jgi:hypothetical protein
MNKDIQIYIEKIVAAQMYWNIDANTTLLLEILNTISFIPGINYRILNIETAPSMQVHGY